MWIRTQDRLTLINFYSYNKVEIEDISIIEEKHDYVIIAYKDEDGIILGTYSSEENALETLDYITTGIALEKTGIDMPIEENGKLLKGEL